jgi:hypothetical protein
MLRVSASDDIPLFPDSAKVPKTSGIATASTPMAITVSISEEPRWVAGNAVIGWSGKDAP